jgi:hypothetical protein
VSVGFVGEHGFDAGGGAREADPRLGIEPDGGLLCPVEDVGCPVGELDRHA